MATPVEILAPCYLCKEGPQLLVMAGDAFQLRAILANRFMVSCGMDISTMEHLLRNNKLYSLEEPNTNYVSFQNTQYRCPEFLMSVPNDLFYGNRVKTVKPPDDILPVHLEFVAGIEKRNRWGSFSNTDECTAVCKIIRKLLSRGVLQHEITIISPYRQQIRQLSNMLLTNKWNIQLGSIDVLQGSSNKYILLSTVRSAPFDKCVLHKLYYDQVGFNSEPHRFMVAVSRAESSLFIIGHLFQLASSKYWAALLWKVLNELPHGLSEDVTKSLKEVITTMWKENNYGI